MSGRNCWSRRAHSQIAAKAKGGLVGRFRVGLESGLPVGAQVVVEATRDDVLVVRTEDGFFGVSNLCSHEEFELCGGEIAGGRIKCSRHGSWFELATGAARNLPAVAPIQTFEVSIEDGVVFVTAP